MAIIRGRANVAVIGLVLAAALVATEAAQAWAALYGGGRSGALSTVAVGELCSVQLVNGQVYYGSFVDAVAGHVRLKNVYYVQTVVESPGSAQSNRLVNRRKTDWHAPEWTSIPLDKVLMVEAVGAGSRLAQLIEQDQKAGGASAAK